MNNFKNLFFAATIMSVAFVGCSKDEDKDDTTTPPPAEIKCKLLSTSEVQDSSNYAHAYTYNASGSISNVSYSYNGNNNQYSNYDSVVYDANGVLSKIVEVSAYAGVTTINRTYSYTYASGKISKIEEVSNDWNGGTTTANFNYTYSNGNLSSMIPDNGDMAFKNITWANGNIATVDLDADGSGQMVIKLKVETVDAKKNVAKHSLPKPDNIIEYYNANNYVKIVTVEEVDLGGGPMPAGSAILERSYTYNSEGEVTVRVEKPSAFDGGQGSDRTTTYTYECK